MMYTIFVGNCAGASRLDLEDEFRQFGKILHIALHKTYAFVDFDAREAAEDAVRLKHHSLFKGRPLTVEHSDSKTGPNKKNSEGSGAGGSGGVKNERDRSRSGTGPRDRDRGRSREFRDDGPRMGGGGGGRGGFSPPPPRPDISLEARLREVAERERLIELEQQIMIKEQQAQEMLIAQEMEKRKMEMMELERSSAAASSSQGQMGPPSGPGGSVHSRHRQMSPKRFPEERFPDEFEPPAAKQRRGVNNSSFGNNDHLDMYRNMVDCCVIYVDKQLRSYAESVQNVCVAAGLVADVQFISRDESLAGTLDNLSQKGIISAVILDELNEQRKTANVHFLHGTPRGEIQTGISELPHWLRMHEEYNKYLVVTGKRTQSLRELLAELCDNRGGSGRGDNNSTMPDRHPQMGGGGPGSMGQEQSSRSFAR